MIELKKNREVYKPIRNSVSGSLTLCLTSTSMGGFFRLMIIINLNLCNISSILLYNLKFSGRWLFGWREPTSEAGRRLPLHWRCLLFLVFTEVFFSFFQFSIVLILFLIEWNSKFRWTPFLLKFICWWAHLLKFIWTLYPIYNINLTNMMLWCLKVSLKIYQYFWFIIRSVLYSFRAFIQKIFHLIRLKRIIHWILKSIESCFFYAFLNAIVKKVMIWLIETVLTSSWWKPTFFPHLSNSVNIIIVSLTIRSVRVLTSAENAWLQF